MSILFFAVAAAAQSAANDYDLPQNWLCRPDRHDVCAVDQPVVRIGPGGMMTRAILPKASTPPDADCFYVYPTTSLDDTPNSDMVVGQEEWDRATAQFARFSTVCQTYAPLYRQVTLTTLRRRLRRETVDADPELGYRDVRDAWRNYLVRDNRGRPFALIGHSQGSMLLQRLIAEEIDGKPVQRRMLSAILPGTSLLVPTGKVVGGDFKTIPLCRSETQTGCAISWSSYRDANPPPANALFGVSKTPGMKAACTNPAKLQGGRAALDSVFGFPWWRGGVAIGFKPEDSWQIDGKPIPARFVTVPGRLSGECAKGANGNFLSVHVNVAPQTPFDRELTGGAVIGDDGYPDWGFHVVDVAIVQGDLLRLVSTQSAAWHAQKH